MAIVRYVVTILDKSDNCVFSAIIPSFEIERVINLAECKFGIDFYMTVSPLLLRFGASPVYVDKISYHG